MKHPRKQQAKAIDTERCLRAARARWTARGLDNLSQGWGNRHPLTLRPKLALALLVALGALTTAELAGAAVAYRDTLTPARWDAVRAGLDPSLPLLVGTPWLDPLARHELADRARLDAAAPADLRGVPRYQVLSYRGRAPAHTALLARTADLPPPQASLRQRWGPLVLTTYDQNTSPPRDDLLAHWRPGGVSLRTGDGRCRPGSDDFTCRGRGLTLARTEVAVGEVDGSPQRCALASLRDGVRLEASVTDFEFGDAVRGHVGFAGMNARLRSDAPVTVALWRDDEALGRWTFTDDQGWAALAVATTPGAATLRIEIQGAVQGVWGREGYTTRSEHPVCFELRSFDEAGA